MKVEKYINEIWKPIPGYFGLYECSNFGRVRSVDRIVKSTSRNGNIYEKLFKGKIIKQHKDGAGKYLQVVLCKDGVYKTYLVHRIVAVTFIPNPHNYPCVNHKDEDKTNNFVWVNDDGTVDPDKSNLEWCTYKYNSNYGTGILRKVEKESIPVIQYNLNGVKIKEWKSSREAERGLKEQGYTNGITSGNIIGCCRGRQKTACGFIWRYGKQRENYL